jgi:hypothetical protein
MTVPILKAREAAEDRSRYEPSLLTVPKKDPKSMLKTLWPKVYVLTCLQSMSG